MSQDYMSGFRDAADRFEEGKNRMALRVEMYRLAALIVAFVALLSVLR